MTNSGIRLTLAEQRFSEARMRVDVACAALREALDAVHDGAQSMAALDAAQRRVMGTTGAARVAAYALLQLRKRESWSRWLDAARSLR